MTKRLYTLVEISLLATLISVSGAIKIPTFIIGSEFQMSAPLAVAICAVFGFKRYIVAGIISSLLLFMLGLHSLINVGVAMIFRLVVGCVILLFGSRSIPLILAGPLATCIARITLGFILQIPFTFLLLPAVPGMILTALTTVPLVKVLERIYSQVGVRQLGKQI